MTTTATAWHAPVIDDAQRAAFERDGVVQVRSAISPAWVERMRRFAHAQMERPSRWVNDQSAADNSGGRLFTDRYLWRENAEVRAYVFESGIAGVVGALVGCQRLRFYFDHLLTKAPGTAARTPWHQDAPYWPFAGRQIASAWVALTDATIEGSAMEFVRGSHRWDRTFRPEVFGDAERSSTAAWQTRSAQEKVPDIEADRSAYDIVGWDMKAGDAVVFSAWTLHGARGNATSDQPRIALSTRWLGDDALWAPHPAADPTVTQADVSVQPGQPANDDDRFPIVWRRAGG